MGAYDPSTDISQWPGPSYLTSWFSEDGHNQAYLLVGSSWKTLGADFGMLQSTGHGQPRYDFLTLSYAYRPDIDGRAALPYVIWLSDGAGSSWPAGVLRRCVFVPGTGLSARQVIQAGSNYMVFPPRRATEAILYRIGLLKD